MQLGAWLLGLVQPLIGRILFALGFQVVTIVGFTAVIDELKDLVLQHLGTVPAAGLQMALLAGVGTAIGLIFGAITTRLALWQIQNSVKLLGVAS